MNMTEELNENVENGEEVEVKRGRGRPKIPDELKKTKPKVHSGLPRGRPRIHPVKSRLTKTMKKPKVLEINIGDKAQISLIKDFTNDDMLDTLPVKFVTTPHDVRGRPVKNTISQQIELVVIKPNNGKRGRPRNHVSHDESDSSDDDSHTSSRDQSQPSPSKGRGRPRKSSYDKTNNNAEIYNKPSTSKGRGRPRKTPMKSVQSSIRGISRTPHISYTEYNESDYSDDEDYNHTKSPSKRQSQPSTSKGRGRPRKSPRIDIDDLEVMPSTLSRGRPRTKVEIDDDSNSVSSSETKSKGRGRPRKQTKNTISSSSSLTSSSKGRGRPRKYPMTSVSDTESGINDSPSTSKGRGRPRKYPKIETPIDEDKPKKGRGRPKKLSKPMKAMILTVDDGDIAIEHVLNDDQEGISKQKPGRGRPRKEVKVIHDTSDNGEGNTEFESQNNSGDIHLAESGVEEENQTTTDNSSNCEDIEYSIGLNDEETEIPLEDIDAEPVSEIIS